MAWFDPPSRKYPRRWNEFSLDFKLFYGFEIFLFAAIVLGDAWAGIGDTVFYGAMATAACVLALVSLANRRRRNWHWPGLASAGVIKPLLITAAMAAFLYVFSMSLFPLSHATAPMFLFALAICVFNTLNAFDLVQLSETEFETRCGDSPAAAPADANDDGEPGWKKLVRGVYRAAFVLIWIDGLAFFYFHQRFMAEATHVPVPGRTQFFADHGASFYVTAAQMQLNEVLQTAMMVGIPVVLASGFFIQFVVGVPLFASTQGRDGLFGRRGDRP